MTFSQEAGLILIGAGIGLITSLAMAIVQHMLGTRQLDKTLKSQRELVERQLEEQRALEEWKLEREKENARELLAQEMELEERRQEQALLARIDDPEEVARRMQAFRNWWREDDTSYESEDFRLKEGWRIIRDPWPEMESILIRRVLTRRLLVSAISSFVLATITVLLVALLA